MRNRSPSNYPSSNVITVTHHQKRQKTNEFENQKKLKRLVYLTYGSTLIATASVNASKLKTIKLNNRYSKLSLYTRCISPKPVTRLRGLYPPNHCAWVTQLLLKKCRNGSETALHHKDISLKGAVLPAGSMMHRLALPTRYTLQGNTASIMKKRNIKYGYTVKLLNLKTTTMPVLPKNNSSDG